MGKVARRLASKPMRDLTETEWQQWVVEKAEEAGWLTCHVRRAMVKGRWVTNTSVAGFPDLTLLRPATGQLVFLELKKERGGVTSDEQAEWIAGLQAVEGVEAYIVRPSDHAEVLDLLARPRPPDPPA